MNPKCGLNSSPPPTPNIQDTSCRGGVRCGRRGEVDEALGRDAKNGESRGQMLPLSCSGSGRGCLPMSPSWRCKGLPPKGPTCCHPRAPGRRRKPRSSIPLGSRSSSQGSGRGKRPGAKCPELRDARRSLTQKQQLELAARVLLVPAKLPLDLGADALRLLLLRGQAAAAGHGTRSPRQATKSRAPLTLRRPIRDGTGVRREKTRADSSFGVRGRDRPGSVPPGRASPGRERIRSSGNAQVYRRSRLTQPHAGEGGRRAEGESVAGPRKPARLLAQELDSLGAQTARENLGRRGAGSPGLGDVPGRLQARRGLEAEVLAGPLLQKF